MKDETFSEAMRIINGIASRSKGIINAADPEVVKEICRITRGFYYTLNGRIQTEYKNHIIYAIIK